MALIDGLVSYYKFDEAANADATDSHGSNTATNVGANTGTATGKLNGARDLEKSDTDSYFQKTSPTGLNNQDFSVSFWMNPESIATFDVPMMYGQDENWANGWGFWFDTGPILRFWVESYNTDTLVTGTISTATWYHIVGTYTAGSMKLYVDGSEVATGSRSVTITFTGAVLELGRGRNTPYEYDGLLDEGAIYSRVLDSTEVLELFGSGTPPAYPFSSAAVVAWLTA